MVAALTRNARPAADDCRRPFDAASMSGAGNAEWPADSVSAIEENDRILADPIFQRLKKIGDLGSHAGDVGREDLLDAFEDMDIVLGIIYGMENEPAVARIKAQIKSNIRRKRRRG